MMRLCIILAALLAIASASSPAGAAARGPAKRPPVCRLLIEGFGSRPGIKAARFDCRGGTIKAAARPELRKHLEKAIPGVVLVDASGYAVDGALPCLLYVLDGSVAVFQGPRVAGMLAASHSTLDDLSALVCVYEGSRVTFLGGTFKGCDRRVVAVDGDATDVHVGACNFSHNIGDVAGTFGAALAATGAAELSIQGCTFDGNVAAAGGAIWATDDAVVRVLAGSEQRSDRAPTIPPSVLDRGVVGQRGPQGRPTVFVNNSVRVVDGTTTSQGGAIYANQRARLVVSGARFLANKAADGGGAAKLDGESSLTLVDTSVVNCSATSGDGGGISSSDSSSLSVVRSTIQGCQAVQGTGGGIMVAGAAAVQLNSSRLVANTAGYGGGVRLEGNATAAMHNISIINCSATLGAGGGISAYGGGALTMTACAVAGCSSVVGGGAVYVGGQRRAALSGTYLMGNTAYIGGGALLQDQSTMVFRGGAIVNCSSTNGGSGISLSGTSKFTLVGSAVRGCTCESHGGGGVRANDKAAVLAINSTLAYNMATWGGAFKLEDGSSLQVQGGAIIGCGASGGGGGGISLMEDARATLKGVTIKACSSMQGGGGGLSAAGRAVAMLQRCSLRNNTAGGQDAREWVAGGGLLADGDAKLALQGVLIAGNTAADGGGVYVSGAAVLQLAAPPTHVQGNVAWRVGGGLLLGSANFDPAALPGGDSPLVVVANNSSPLGGDVSFQALSLSVLNSSSNLGAFIPSTSHSGLHVALNVSGPRGLPAADVVRVSLADGPTNVSKLLDEVHSSSAAPVTNVDVQLGSTSGPGSYSLVFSLADDTTVAPARLPLRIIPCPRGYVRVGGGRCRPCERGFFSFDPSAQDCQVCVHDAVCPGGARVWPAQEFWHSAPQSTQMHRCFNPAACVGGAAAAAAAAAVAASSSAQPPLASGPAGVASQAYKTAQCSAPYQGNLCGSCKPGFGKMRAFMCRQCMPLGGVVAVHVIAVVALTFLVKLLTFLQALSSKGAGQPTGSSGGGGMAQQPTPFELLKVLVLHLQWLYILSSLVGVPWPPTLVWPMHALGSLWSGASGSSIGMECILPHNTVPVPVQKLLLCLFTPAAIMGAVLLFEAVMRRVRPRRAVGARHAFVSLAICIVFVFLPTWVHTTLSLFTCVSLDKPAAPPYQAAAVGTWWVEDMSQRCYSSEPGMYHRAWALGLGVPLVVLLCLCLPAGVFAFMWLSRRQGRLSHTSFRLHYGFMFRPWRREVCWWDAVVVLQTIALVMVATFGFALGPLFQPLVAAAVLAAVTILLAVVRPFECACVNTIAIQSASVLLFTAYAAITFLSHDGVAAGPVYGAIMGVVVLVANLAFLAATAWRAGRAALARGILAPLGRWVSAVTGGRCRSCGAGCCSCWHRLCGGCGMCACCGESTAAAKCWSGKGPPEPTTQL